jgi:hypothetical protein
MLLWKSKHGENAGTPVQRIQHTAQGGVVEGIAE